MGVAPGCQSKRMAGPNTSLATNSGYAEQRSIWREEPSTNHMAMVNINYQFYGV